MPLPPKPDVSKAATPTYGPSFDPWNSSSTGHQRAENRLGGSTGWRDSRSAKLQLQFKGGADGGKRMFDAVGAGSQDWDPKLQAVVPQELRARVRNSVLDMLSKPGMMKQSMASPSRCSTSTPADKEHKSSTMEDKLTNKRQVEDEAREKEENRSRKVLDGVVVYINGSTHPIISDHKLKHVLVEHGARLSIHLGRRQVTHVILGRPAGGRSGSGGGLAGGKLRKEIQRIGGAPVKFVGVEWILESIKAGKRLPEARFSNVKIAPKGQQSAFGMTSKASAPTPLPPTLVPTSKTSSSRATPDQGQHLHVQTTRRAHPTTMSRRKEPSLPTAPVDEPPPSGQRL